MPGIVLFYPARAIPLMAETAQLGFDKIFLNAGSNKLSPEELQQLKDHPDFARYSEIGALEVIEEEPVTIDPQANTNLADLMSFKEAEAIKIVNNTNSLETLESWLNVEQRSKVRTILNTRITQLKTGAI
jgi:hypothetical protein